jgi:putative ABC transport system permease protein
MPDFAAPAEPAAEPAVAEPGPTQVTAVFVGAKSRIDALRLQREIGTDPAEPLTAVIPGMALAEMWRGIGYAEGALRLVTLFVVLVGLLGMLISLYTSLDARRREMAILRAVGAGPRRIVGLLVLESGLLAALGSAIGVGLVYLLLFALQVPVEQRFGLFLAIRPLGAAEYAYLGAVIGAGVLLGLVPALRAYRNALVDGLSVRG